MKLLSLYFVALLAVINPSFGMQQKTSALVPEARFSKLSITIPLEQTVRPRVVHKEVFVLLPDNLIDAHGQAQEQKHIPPSVARSVASTLLDVYTEEARKELCTIFEVFRSLMFDKIRGDAIPALEDLANVDEELHTFVAAKGTYFIYQRAAKQLLLRWDLGEHADGWAFNKIISVCYDPTLPRKGTRSDIMLQFHNVQKNIHGKVALAQLIELDLAAGRQTVWVTENSKKRAEVKSFDQWTNLLATDIVAMALHYVSDPEKLKDAIEINVSSADKEIRSSI
ncbi:MAG: hypothetical protein AB7F19_00185 [Candidatus Babeliales bacterium]